MEGTAVAFMWQRTQLSRAWQVAHDASVPPSRVPWLATNAVSLWLAGRGSRPTRAGLNAVAAVSGTWQVRQRLDSS